MGGYPGSSRQPQSNHMRPAIGRTSPGYCQKGMSPWKKCYIAGLGDKGATNQGMRAVLGSGKGKEMHSSIEPAERNIAFPTP